MSTDRRFVIGILGAALSCLACLTPDAVLALGAIGFTAWAGQVDPILAPLFVAFLGVAIYRFGVMCRRTS
jgi:hypothetical protein